MKRKVQIMLAAPLVVVAVAAYVVLTPARAPVYTYESSDRGMAEFEAKSMWGGEDRTLAFVESEFEEYKAFKGDPRLKLMRTSKRNWYSPNLWWDNLTNRRWKYPYAEPSPEPDRNWQFHLPHISAEETIKLATVQYYEGPPPEIESRWKRSNPDARETLYRILDDPQQWRHWGITAMTIGYAGKAEDVDRLLGRLRELRGRSPGVSGAVSGIRQAIITMRQRQVAGAKEAVSDMCLPEFWAAMQFETADVRPPGYFTFPNDEAYTTVRILSNESGSNPKELVERLLTHVPDHGQRELILKWANYKRQLVDPQKWSNGSPSTDPDAG